MIDWTVPFIGRDEQLETIQTHIQAWNSRRIIFVWGDGGVGKTRLLHEVGKRFAPADTSQKMLPVIDFDDDTYEISQNLGFGIAQNLDRERFAPYLEALGQLHLAEKWAVEQGGELPARQAIAVNRSFIECFNQVSAQERIILREDRTDALQSTMPLTYLLETVAYLQNVVVLIAGRNAGEVYKQYQEQFGEDAVVLSLCPFTLADSRDYLERKQKILKVTLEAEWMDKLFLLVGGLPVLIDLAIEWAQNHRKLIWMDELSLSDLETLVL